MKYYENQQMLCLLPLLPKKIKVRHQFPNETFDLFELVVRILGRFSFQQVKTLNDTVEFVLELHSANLLRE